MKRAILLILAAVLTLGLAACGGGDQEYLDELAATGLFVNAPGSEMPQTVVHDIVMDHFDKPLADGTTQKMCCVIGIDGTRPDALPLLVQDSGIHRIAAEGGLYLTRSGGDEEHKQETNTAPSWASILTGVWKDQHGVTRNYAEKAAEYPTFVAELAQKKGVTGMLAFGWDGHVSEICRSTYLPERDASRAAGLDVAYHDFAADTEIRDAMLDMAKNETNSCVFFCVLDDVDSVGHADGFDIKEEDYVAEVQDCNAMVEEIYKAIQDRPTYSSEDWLVLVTTDHGGTTGGNHGNRVISCQETWLVSNRALDPSLYGG